MNNPMLFAVGLAVGGGFLLLYFLIDALFGEKRDGRDARVASPDDEPLIIHSPDDEPPPWDERMDSGFERMVTGARLGMPADKALATICLLAVLVGGALYLWRDQLWLGLAGGFAALTLLVGWVWFQRGKLKQELQEQMPDFLFLLSRSLRAGMNLEQALRLAIDQNLQPVSDAVRPLLGHLRVGLPLPRALERVAREVGLTDFDTFVSVVAFHRANGGNLPLLLDRLGQSIRDRNQFRGHLKATTAQARFTALLVGMVGPLLLVGYLVFQPDHVMAFFQSPWGWGIIAGALLVELIAAVVMYQILRVDY